MYQLTEGECTIYLNGKPYYVISDASRDGVPGYQTLFGITVWFFHHFTEEMNPFGVFSL